MDDENLDTNPQNEAEQPDKENNLSESTDLENQDNEDTTKLKETQEETETSEVEKEAVPDVSTEIKPQKTAGWLRKTLIGLVIIVLIFAAGFIVAQIAYTSPVRSSLDQVTTEKNQIQKELSSVQDQFATSQNDLENKKAELTVTQSDLRTAESTIEQLKTKETFNRNLEEIKYHVALARIALLNEDKLSARQALNLAQDNLDELTPLLEADNLQAVKQRLEDAYSLSISDFGKALEELRTLTENLERIPIK
jgi:hypothetical protein